MDKKTAADWNIAATHYLTAGFLAPLIIVLGSQYVVAAFVSAQPLILALLGLVTVPLSFWVGAQYSAKYISKKYTMQDPTKVIRLATIYMVVLNGLYQLYLLTAFGVNLEYLISLVAFGLGVAAFYKASKKYLAIPSAISA